MDKQLQYTLSLKDLFSSKMKDAENATERLDSKVNGLGSKIKNLAIGLGGVFAVKSIVNATANFQSLENSINATSTSGAKDIRFLNDQVDRLGLDITSAYKGYKTFSGALMGTTLAGEAGNKVFRQVSEASTVMQLSGEQTEGAFLALGQMMSKGTVSAEELRGQLGERIPGAFQIAARAMGVTTKKLGEMMQKGEVVASEFLPKFGNELEKAFGSKANKASKSLQSNINKMDASFERLKVSAGEALLPAIISVTQAVTKFFNFIKNNIQTVKFLVGVVLTLVTAFYAYKAIMTSIAILQGGKMLFSLISLSAGLQGTTVAQYALNTAMMANPIGLVVGAIALLILQLKVLYDQYERIKGQFQKAETGIQTAYFTGIKKEVNSLADSYEKLGMTRKEAEGKAINDVSGKIDKGMAKNFAKLKSGEITKEAFDYASKVGATAKAGLKNVFNKPTIAGTSATNPSLTDASTSGKSTSTGGTEISGSKPQSLTINITKLVESLNVNTTNLKDSAEKIKEAVSKVLLEAVNDVNLVTR